MLELEGGSKMYTVINFRELEEEAKQLEQEEESTPKVVLVSLAIAFVFVIGFYGFLAIFY